MMQEQQNKMADALAEATSSCRIDSVEQVSV
jgi:hypothetical protein